MKDDFYFMSLAINEAKKSLSENGIPIGAVLVIDGELIGRGHNRLIQNNSSILHGELDAIENSGFLTYEQYKKSTLYTTLSPCPMCSGAILLYNIPKVVIGDNKTLMGSENLLKDNGVEVVLLNDKRCTDLFNEFLDKSPELWENQLKRVGNSTSLK